MFLVLFAGLMMAQCSTYSMKSDMSKNGVINKTPKWYVNYPHTTKKTYQEAASAVSPDLELAVKKATLLAKAKLADRINGEMNNRSTINKNEAGTNESMTVTAQSQEKRLQSEDRAHRIGQKKAVTYVDLVAPKTVDEKIRKALRKKINIATQVMGEELRDWI